MAISPAGTFAYVTDRQNNHDGSGTVSRVKLANAIPLVITTEPVSSRAIAAYAKLTISNGATISVSVAQSIFQAMTITVTK